MNIRLVRWSIFVLVIIAGLIAGLFMPVIQRSLAMPVAQGKGMGGALQMPGGMALPPAAPTKPAVVATAPAKPPVPATPAIPPGVVASDSFQRANQPLWGAASDTQLWAGEANTNGNVFSIVNGAGQVANGQGSFNALLGMAGTNMSVVGSASVNTFIGDSNKVNFGLVVRWTDSNNWYKALIDGNNLIVVKRVNGVSKQLMKVAFNAVGGQVYSIHLSVIGAMIFANAWLSSAVEPQRWMITANDTDLVQGQGGIRILVQNDTVVRVHSFLDTVAKSEI